MPSPAAKVRSCCCRGWAASEIQKKAKVKVREFLECFGSFGSVWECLESLGMRGGEAGALDPASPPRKHSTHTPRCIPFILTDPFPYIPPMLRSASCTYSLWLDEGVVRHPQARGTRPCRGCGAAVRACHAPHGRTLSDAELMPLSRRRASAARVPVLSYMRAPRACVRARSAPVHKT